MGVKMNQRKLNFFFKPKSVAVIGASDTKGKVGYSVMKNIIASNYKGEIYPINPKKRSIMGHMAYKSVLDVENEIDIAVICIPARFVPEVMKECGEKRIKGVVIITAGFKEVGLEGADLEREIQRIAKENNIRIIGPNCLGIITPYINATFASKAPKKGHIAMISQSGAMMTAILDWAEQNNIGFSSFVSLGNKADLDEVDFIEAFSLDPDVNTIILYIESVNDGNKFLKIVPDAAQKKPVIILKSGTSEAGSRAASSHTGALAGNDISFSLAFEKCKVLRVREMGELFDLSRLFSKVNLPKGKKFAIVTNAGGPGIVATDAFESYKLGLSRFSNATIQKLREVLPSEAAVYNPVDIVGDAPPSRYKEALEIIFQEDNSSVAGALVLVTPQAQTRPTEVSDVLIECQQKYPDKIIVAVFMGGESMNKAIEKLSNTQIPYYNFPEPAIKSLKQIVKYSDLLKLPNINQIKIPKFRISTKRIKEIIENARKDGRNILLSSESSEIFRIYGIKNPTTYLAQSVTEVEKYALKLGFPLVMKIVSPDIIHKSDIGGVVLDIKNVDEAKEAYLRIINMAKRFGPPNARIYGVELQEMIEKSKYKKITELILGMSKDPQWGPLLMVGMGGIYTNFIKDVSFDLAYKYTMDDAYKQLSKTKIYTILRGVRGEPRSDIEAIIDVLRRLSQMVNEIPDIVELDINPLLVFEETKEHDGYSAVDIKITISKKPTINKQIKQ
ncbi:MAG: acetate--CoA ligase alpha subunit [Promethearchaeota archaeon]